MRLLFLHDGAGRGVDPYELDEAELIEIYRHPAGPDGRAWLRTNFVATLDGSISGADGRSGSINTASDQHVFGLHRALADVILVGAQTVRTEGYRAVDLADWQREIRSRQGLRPFPTLAVVSRSLDLDPALAHPDRPHGPVMIITTGHPLAELEPFRDAGIEISSVESSEDQQADLTRAVGDLAAAGMPRILCEGGPRLHRDLLAADLVDELSLTLSPQVVGGAGQRATSGAALPHQLGFDLHHALWAEDQTLFTGYRRRRTGR
ncbi:MAG TPA: dihydrofolate reductase family protein [Microlunatus sp.]